MNALWAGRWRRPLFRSKQHPPVEGVAFVSMDGGSWIGGGVYCKKGAQWRRWRSRGVGVGSGVGGRWVKRCVWLPGGAHARFLTCREAPTRSIRALYEGADTGLPVLLLGLKTSQPFRAHRCEPKNHTDAQNAIEAAMGRAGEHSLNLRRVTVVFSRRGSYVQGSPSMLISKQRPMHF
jgi:hypothetical protein